MPSAWWLPSFTNTQPSNDTVASWAGSFAAAQTSCHTLPLMPAVPSEGKDVAEVVGEMTSGAGGEDGVTVGAAVATGLG
jgi:hypothetical protein